MNLVSCAVCSDGAVDCWGDTSRRVLAGRSRRTPSDAVRIAGATGAIGVAVSAHAACVLDRAGRVRCWGNQGSAGSDAIHDQGTQPAIPEIVDVALPAAAVAVEVGDLHACALLVTSEVACWGRNDWGQLGVDVVGSGPGHTVVPTVIPQLLASRIAVADNVSCAVDTAHRAWCWGWNGSGATGKGDRRRRIGPVRVARFDDVTDIATDGSEACLRRADGEVWCWGQPDRLEKATPVPALRTRLPPGHSLTIDGGAVSAIGDDRMVSIAAGASPPKPIASLLAVRALSRRDGGACAVLITGELQCWGDNRGAELVIEAER
ncbi:MAG TPA: hypothetical protein VLM79_38850 [Kofleriaceae bacterium]|nr:hypothetical protein [Kofleriaceae bacterium]